MIKVAFDWPVAERRVVRHTIQFTARGLDDLRPVFNRFRGVLRSRHADTFRRMVDPITNEAWTPLTPEYAARKAGIQRGRRAVLRSARAAGLSVPGLTRQQILVDLGRMKKALTVYGAEWAFYQVTKRAMLWGIDPTEIYPIFHQTTAKFRKDGKPLRRGYVGMRIDEDAPAFLRLVETHVLALWARARTGGDYPFTAEASI